MKTPAAMARSPMIMPRPAQLKLSNAINPYKIRKIANNRKPIFLVNLIVVLLSNLN